MQWIKLQGGTEVFIDEGTKYGKCKSCGAQIIWGVTKNSKYMPILKVDGQWLSHFANCPNAEKHRKGEI